MADSYLLHLLQWSDSSLPTGGFAYSHGLESLVHAGRVRSVVEVAQVLLAQAVSLAGGEIVGLWHVSRARHPARTCALVGTRLLASLWPKEARQQSMRTGERLWQIAWELSRGRVPRVDGPLLAGPVAGLAARAFGFPPEDAARAFLLNHLLQGASAAVRLLSLDPVAVHRALWDLTPTLEVLLAWARGRSLGAIGNFAPMVEIAVMGHEYEELRLFRS